MNFPKTISRAISLCFCLLFAHLIYSQNSVLISYGANLQGELEEFGETDSYSFNGAIGDVIMLRMRDEEKVDSYIEVYSPSGELLVSEWSDGGLAEITSLTLSETGQYEILAFDKNNNDTGVYGLSLHQLNSPYYATPLGSFESVEGEIETYCAVDMYQFSAYQGDVLYADLRGESIHFEGEFFIYNSIGEVVYSSEKNGGRQVLDRVTIPFTDSYTVAVVENGGNDLASYGFTLNLLNRHEDAPVLECSKNRSFQLDQLVDREVYRIDSPEDYVHFVESRSNNINVELCLEIFDDQGNKVYSSVNTNRLNHAFLDGYNSSSYLLAVFDEHGNDTGEAGIQVHNLSEYGCSSMLSCGVMEETIVTKKLAFSKSYLVEGVKDSPIDIQLGKEGGPHEPHLRLYNMQGEMLAESAGRDIADLSETTYPENEMYVLLVSDHNGNESGDLVLDYEGGDLQVFLQECHTSVVGNLVQHYVHICAESYEDDVYYEWSNGMTGFEINVLVEEETEFTVTVTNNEGCSKVLSTIVEVQNVDCGNNGNKVRICKVDYYGYEDQKCVNSGWANYYLQYYPNSYVGECGYDYICTESSNIQVSNETTTLIADEETEGIELRSSEEAKCSSVYPNPTSDVAFIESSNVIESYEVYTNEGALIHSKEMSIRTSRVELNPSIYNGQPGVYFIKVNTVQGEDVHRMLYIN